MIYFFSASANWDGVSVEVCIVTERSHLWKTVATELETHKWTGKTRIALSFMHYFTFTYIKYLLFTQLLYLVRSFFDHEEALVLTTLNNLLSSVYLVTSLFTPFFHITYEHVEQHRPEHRYCRISLLTSLHLSFLTFSFLSFNQIESCQSFGSHPMAA